MTDPNPDPTGLGIHRPMTVPVVPVAAPEPAEPAAPVELPSSYTRPVVNTAE